MSEITLQTEYPAYRLAKFASIYASGRGRASNIAWNFALNLELGSIVRLLYKVSIAGRCRPRSHSVLSM